MLFNIVNILEQCGQQNIVQILFSSTWNKLFILAHFLLCNIRTYFHNSFHGNNESVAMSLVKFPRTDAGAWCSYIVLY